MTGCCKGRRGLLTPSSCGSKENACKKRLFNRKLQKEKMDIGRERGVIQAEDKRESRP